MSATKISIELLRGSVAPRYCVTEVTELDIQKVIITEHGMQSGMPLIDFQMADVDGKRYFGCLSGKMLAAIAVAVTGVIEGVTSERKNSLDN